MNIIVCLDDGNGMLFNHRRQSQDRILRQRVREMISTAGGRLLVNKYSGKLFSADDGIVDGSGSVDVGIGVGADGSVADDAYTVVVADDFLKKALPGDFCFVETEGLAAYEEKMEKLIIYRWNRKYPGDFFFDLNLEEWKKIGSEDFSGSSHDKITEEIYIKAGL